MRELIGHVSDDSVDSKGEGGECPDANLIVEYAFGRLRGDDFEALVDHLNGCPDCSHDAAALIKEEKPFGDQSSENDEEEERERQEFIRELGQQVREALRAKAPASARGGTRGNPFSGRRPDGASVAYGDRIGRYVVLERIGAGGMGEVFKAYDPTLDRRIALKLLRSELWSKGQDKDAKGRILREAQAMARVHHANVVSIFDVTEVGTQISIAMEYVEGYTLKTWLREKQRSWQEVRDVFVLAGRGLEAAHRADLVHRDFKPDNVLIDRSGKVGVSDFGMVCQAAGGKAAAEHSFIELAGLKDVERRLNTPLTQSGTIMGTPAYMSPEQLLSKEVDARSDQYSFCVALYEALYGERPYTAKSFEELRHKTVSGDLPPAPKGRHVPAWLRNAVMRGLSKEPDKRYPSMTHLLATLRQDPAKKLRRRLSAAGLVAAAGALVAVMTTLQDSRVQCKASPEELAGVWDPAVKERIWGAFSSSGVPHAIDTFDRTAKRIDEYVKAWNSALVEGCRDTHERHFYSEEILNRRVTCLRQRKRSLRALTNILSRDLRAREVGNAVSAAYSLPALASCADVDALSRTTESSSTAGNAQQRAAHLQLKHKLRDVEVLNNVGLFAEAMSIVNSAIEDSSNHGWQAIHAEALYLRGTLEESTGDYGKAKATFGSAATMAGLLGNSAIFARAYGEQVWIVGARQEHYQDALRMLRNAPNELLKNALADPVETARYLNLDGSILSRMGLTQQARLKFEEALEIQEAEYGYDSPEVAKTLFNLGRLLRKADLVEDAISHYKRALYVTGKTVGPRHFLFGHILGSIGYILVRHGHFDHGLRLIRRCLFIQERTLGKEHFLLASHLRALGEAQLGLGRTDQARQALHRSYRIVADSLGEDVADAGAIHVAFGNCDLAEHRPVEATQRFTQAVAALANKPDHLDFLRQACTGLAAAGRMDDSHRNMLSSVANACQQLGEIHDPPHPLAAEPELWRWLASTLRVDLSDTRDIQGGKANPSGQADSHSSRNQQGG